MKTLSDLTMKQYIDIACGNTDALCDGNSESATSEELSKARKAVIYEYSRIASPAETKSSLNKRRSIAVEMMRFRFFEACEKLIAVKSLDKARPLVAEYGIRVDGMTDDQLANEVKRQMLRSLANIKRAKSMQDDAGETGLSPEQTRAQFDQQTASLMTYFKFQIDINTIGAATYAYMVQQASREIKARMAAIKKR